MSGFQGPNITLVTSGFFGAAGAAPPVSQTTFSITAGIQSFGPFEAPPNSYQNGWGAAAGTPSGFGEGSITPSFVDINGGTLIVFGSIFDVISSQFYLALCVAGVFPQNLFNTVSYVDNDGNPQSFSSALANFNSPWDSTASDFTIWTWQPVLDSVAFPNPITVTW